jgi:hypothetical protein
MGRNGSCGEVQIFAVKETGMAILGASVIFYVSFPGFPVLRIVHFPSLTVKRENAHD